MKQFQHLLRVRTRAGLVEITAPVRAWLDEQAIATGLLTLFCRHTSASLLIQENADPDVRTDLLNFFADLVPERRPWVHAAEGPDDMPAHARAALTQVSLGIPVSGGKMALGSWQGIYVFEHRRAPHERDIFLHLLGD